MKLRTPPLRDKNIAPVFFFLSFLRKKNIAPAVASSEEDGPRMGRLQHDMCIQIWVCMYLKKNMGLCRVASTVRHPRHSDMESVSHSVIDGDSGQPMSPPVAGSEVVRALTSV
jgi:hypothetical protein